MKILIELPNQGMRFPAHTFELEVVDGMLEIEALSECEVDLLTVADLRTIADALETSHD
jgi:hypothetical protein